MTGESSRTRRIAVALDASEQSQRVMAIAAGIAAALEAEVEGVFVEDSEVLRAAGLPFLREFRLSTRGESSMDAERLQRELRAVARRVRGLLEQSAQRLGCSWSFRVWRGDLEAEILSAASDAEMFALVPMGRFAPFRSRPTAMTAAGGGLAVTLLFDGSAGALRVLAAAAELAGHSQGALDVILQGQDAVEIERLRALASEFLGKAADQTRFAPLVGREPSAFAEAVLGAGGDLFIIDAENRLLDRSTLWQSLAALRCPMLIVR